MQNDGLIFAEYIAVSDGKQQGIADLTGWACYQNAQWFHFDER